MERELIKERINLRIKRATFSISINKIVAVGCNLFKGKELYCYLIEDKGRPAMMVYLDGDKR